MIDTLAWLNGTPPQYLEKNITITWIGGGGGGGTAGYSKLWLVTVDYGRLQ